jgi:hypothetical protein
MKPSVFKNPAVVFVALILALETLVIGAITGFLVFEVLTQRPDSLSTAIGLVVLVALAFVWIAATTITFIRGNASSRGSALVWQVLQAALGLASNQGLFARPDIGSALLIPALAVMGVLLFSKNINKHFGVGES